jgi:hypothetical protein
MDDISMEDTAAYRVVRQIVNHGWGNDEDISEEDLVQISGDFHARGGLWEDLMGGDITAVGLLEDAIGDLINRRNLIKIAKRISG